MSAIHDEIGVAGFVPGKVSTFGRCYNEKVKADLGTFPDLVEVLAAPDDGWGEDDDEFGAWESFIPGDQQQVSNRWNDDNGGLSAVFTPSENGAICAHIYRNESETRTLLEQVRMVVGLKCYVGALITDLIERGAEVTGAAEAFLVKALTVTNSYSADAAENYHQLGNCMEELQENGGVREVTRSNFVEIVKSVTSRWSSAKEATAAANVAAAALYSESAWSVNVLNDVMESDDNEEVRQSKLLNLAGIFLKRNAEVSWSQWVLRKKFKAWRADLLGPAKVFARVVGVDEAWIEQSSERAVHSGIPMLVNAVQTLKDAAMPAALVLSKVAAGTAVAASLVVAAGVVMDWYYVDKEQQRLGPIRETIGEVYGYERIVSRAQEAYAISAIISDESYDTSDYTHSVRLDPFFFSIKNEVSLLKDDTAATRLVSNTFLAPLINAATTNNKNFLLLPASVSTETAQRFQKELPMFYFRIVNRLHSHPELWAARRAFELIVARSLVADGSQQPVVMIGANVRQVSKMPRVALNFGPLLSGRDEARHALKGTPKQRNYFRMKTVPDRFSFDSVDKKFDNGVAVSFFSSQDIAKQEFIETCIKAGISQAYVSINIPIVMMDRRIKQWDDTVMNVRYTRRDDGVLSMSILGAAVAGYDNSFWKTMSWVEPHRPVRGYDATVETVAQIGSSYLLHLQIGVGPQESHDTLWKMPDAGHYVLPDLTRESKEMLYFTVPEAKFGQVVKYVIQLNGAKNMFESTTGRILGLEAAVRIGGTTLDKAWNLGHREFISVAAHAIACAGIDKADAIVMIGKLQAFYSEKTGRSWTESAKNGWRKCFGIEQDSRIPGLAKRGRHDYDVVTHWTCRQKSGHGWGEAFVDKAVLVEPVSDDSGTESEAESVDTAPTDIESDDLNEEDAGGASKEETSDAGFFDFFTKWRKPTVVDNKLPDVGDVSTSMRIALGKEADEGFTKSIFDPAGGLSFIEADGQSRSNEAFVSAFGSEEDLKRAMADGAEFPAPDSGAVRVCQLAMDLDRVDLTLNQTTLQGPPTNLGEEFFDKLAGDFFKDFSWESQLRVPSVMLDGIAGAAKSSIVRILIKQSRKSAVIVVPSRKLAQEWRNERVGTTVTRHKLTKNNMSGRHWLVIDEVYAYTRSELACYLSKAKDMGMQVILMGDRKQQYEDGAEITVEDMKVMKVPIMRMLVSNTMPLDALEVLKWAAQGDEFVKMFQTRNAKRHSIFFVDPDHVAFDWIGNAKYENALVYKDRLEPVLGWKRTDQELGFHDGKQIDWLSISRVQGTRAEFSFLLCSKMAKTERWFSQQRGLFYVAVSRHSKGMVMACYQHDLTELDGLVFEHWSKVDGRLTKIQDRERLEAPLKTVLSRKVRSSPILDMMQQRGMVPQLQKVLSLGPIKEDWRPWPKATVNDHEEIVARAAHGFLGLVGAQTPYAETDAVKYPHFQAAMGLWSIRRPNFVDPEPLRAVFPGMNRLAVNQTSKDEVLDLKNVVERTARPRIIEHDEAYIKAEGERLFADVQAAFFDVDGFNDYSREPLTLDWIAGRSSDFVRKYLLSDPFGLTSASVRTYGFLKTQVKVKVKRTFAMEENYGQTVLASPADYNALLGPWSKVFLRNVRLASRRGVFLDSGYSDSELGRALRECDAFSRFHEENYQADVKRQDTSHTPVTLRVFRLALEFYGVPSHLAELYEKQSTYYRYRSLHSGLYDGQAENNLGSGDPFTLIRNIFEVLTVMVERFGVDQLKDVIAIVKGDDYICDRICNLLPVTVPEIRATQLTEDFNKAPYHAGRFLLDSSIVPDPVRMVCKALVKPAKDMDRVNQLAEAFYDRYVSWSERDYHFMRSAVRASYDDFEPALLDCILDLYMAMRDRKVFYDLVQADNVGSRLAIKQKTTDCAAYAVSFFTSDEGLIEAVRNEAVDDIEKLCVSAHIPVFRMKGRPNDLNKRGVWLSIDHAWAVVPIDHLDVDEFNDS